MESVGSLRLTLTFEFTETGRSDFHTEREKLRYASYIEFFRIFGTTSEETRERYRTGRNPRERCVRGGSFAMTWSSLFLFLFVFLFSPPRFATGSRARALHSESKNSSPLASGFPFFCLASSRYFRTRRRRTGKRREGERLTSASGASAKFC